MTKQGTGVRAAIDHDLLVEERDAKYKGAWLKTSLWIQANIEVIKQLGDAAFPVIMIVNKLHRLEGDPTHIDSIDDIVGYGKLASIAAHSVEATKASDSEVTYSEGEPKVFYSGLKSPFS